MTRRIINATTLVNLGAMAVILFAIAYSSRNVIFPIHRIISVEMITKQVRAGERVKYNMTVYRRELCDPKVNRFVFRVDPDGRLVYVQQATFIGSVSGLGTKTYESGFDLDRGLPPGIYETSGYVVNVCSGFNQHEVSIPPTRFEIIP